MSALSSLFGIATGGASLGFNTGNGQADELLQQTAGNVIGGLQESILSGLTGAFNSTLGSVFSNGMDLSCWGSSYSPSEAKVRAPKNFKNDLDGSGVLTSPNTQTLDKFLNSAYANFHGLRWIQNQKKYASCSRKGWQLEGDYYEQNIPKVLDALRQGGYTLTPTGEQLLKNPREPHKVQGKTYPTFTVTKAVVDSGNGQVAGNGGTGGSGTPPKTDSGGFNPLWLLALVGLM